MFLKRYLGPFMLTDFVDSLFINREVRRVNPVSDRWPVNFGHACGHVYPMHYGLRLLTAASPTYCSKSADPGPTRVKENQGSLTPPSPPPPKGNKFPAWYKTRWVLSGVSSLLLSLWSLKFKKLQLLEEAEMIVEEADDIAGVVEKVATVAEKVSTDMADGLPEKGKLKDAVMFVESVSKEAAKDAQLTKQFIHKVEDMKQGLDDLRSIMAEPFIHNTTKKESTN